MENENKQIGGGLQKSKKDKRDIQLGAVFALPKLEELPKEYQVNGFVKIKNQGSSDLCAAFAAAATSEEQEMVELSPEYIFAKAKELTGDPNSWGLNLRDVCKVLTKIGSIEQKDSPFELEI